MWVIIGTAGPTSNRDSIGNFQYLDRHVVFCCYNAVSKNLIYVKNNYKQFGERSFPISVQITEFIG